MQLYLPEIFSASFACNLFFLIALSVLAQPPSQTVGPAKSSWHLTTTTEGEQLFSLQAENAPVAEILAAIKAKTTVPIKVNPALKDELVTTHFTDARLAAALQEIAPFSYIDYSVTGGWKAQPQIAAIYVQGRVTEVPPKNASIKPRTEGFVFAGETDPASEPTQKEKKSDEEPRLEVYAQEGLLTIQAKQQPLTAVLDKLADALKIPLDFRAEPQVSLTIVCQSATVQEAMKHFPDNVQLYYRLHLATHQLEPLQLLVVKSD